MKELNNWKLLFRISSYSTPIEFNFPRMGTDDVFGDTRSSTARYKWLGEKSDASFFLLFRSNLSIDVIRC